MLFEHTISLEVSGNIVCINTGRLSGYVPIGALPLTVKELIIPKPSVSPNVPAGRGSCFKADNTVSVKHNTMEFNKMRYACLTELYMKEMYGYL